jgi:uncharacterized protein YqiB (DUF1249 family)
MNRSIYETNYQRIYPLIDDMINTNKTYKKLKVNGFMDLVIEKIGHDEFSLYHYYEQNGDLMRDPEMTIRINMDRKIAEALTYQQDGLGIYQVVYPEPGKYVPYYRRELNKFLRIWLINLKSQGFYKVLKTA